MRVVRLTIRGRVQGVGFRYFVEDEARAKKLQGWVQNRRDGAVEAVFAGPQETVQAMIETCRRGPPSARVDAIDVQETDGSALAARLAGEAFSVLPTI